MNRREFLKISGAAIAGAFAAALPHIARAESEETPPPASLGRITSWYLQAIREAPEIGAPALEWKSRDSVFPLLASVQGQAPWPSNPTWYRTTEGYIHSAFVQPVEWEVQTRIVSRILPPGLWAQVSVPVSAARWHPESRWEARKLYYENVFRIVDIVRDEQNRPWYQLQEGIEEFRAGPFAPAWEMRVLYPSELQPISAGVVDKWIEVNRADQTLTCYENGEVVKHTRVATGLWGTPTPRGEFNVLYKRHTRRMKGNINGDEYDLTGVPFPVYITWSGVAIHGTYWHNDYGTPHSHGCINVTPTAAKWIFRWVTPEISYPDYTQFADDKNTGTRVIVT
jgi:hypothetical protein